MFGIGFFELCIIVVFILVFFGPKKLPELMRQAGRFFVQARRMTNEVRSSFDTVVQQAEEELHLEKIQKIKEITNDMVSDNVMKEIQEEEKKFKEAIESHEPEADDRDHSEFEPPLK